jgi:hypothetical protein
MRRLLLSTAALIALAGAAIPAHAQSADKPAAPSATSDKPAAPSATPAVPSPSTAEDRTKPTLPSGEKSEGNAQGGPKEIQKADDSLKDPKSSGRTEPSVTDTASKEQEPQGPVLINGAWNVSGAPKDSQTIPAKFSERNDTIDKKPIIAMRLESLDEAQRKTIAAAIGKTNAKVVSIKSGVSQELPAATEMSELPKEAAAMPALAGMKYVQLEDRILLVDAANRIVVGEITR